MHPGILRRRQQHHRLTARHEGLGERPQLVVNPSGPRHPPDPIFPWRGSRIEVASAAFGGLQHQPAPRLFDFEAARRHRCRQRWCVVDCGGEHPSHRLQRLEIGARPPDGPHAAQELDPHRSPDLVQAADGHRSNLRGRSHVGTAAGAAVQVRDSDDAEFAFAFGGFAQTQLVRVPGEDDTDGPVFKNNFVRPRFGLGQAAGIDRGRIHVDGRYVGSQVEADRLNPEQRCEHGRQQVLSAVLLHVIEATGPVDLAFDLARRGGPRHQVRDPIALVLDGFHRDSRDRSEIVRLPARCGIERGPVQVEAICLGSGYPRREPAQVGIRVIQPFGRIRHVTGY